MNDYLQGVLDGARIVTDEGRRDLDVFNDLLKIWDTLSTSTQDALAEMFLDS